MSEAGEDTCWVFGYGSLMWRAGFAFDHFIHATLQGYHRSLCIESIHYRGTPERPGLVFGLAPGGSCCGRAIGVSPTAEAEVLRYLDERELVTNVYERLRLPLLDAHGKKLEAWCYVARTDHVQFVGDLPEDELLRVIEGAHGSSGPNTDYVTQTVNHLIEMGISEPKLELLAKRFRIS